MRHCPHLAILSFHKIGRPPAGQRWTWYYIPEQVFVAQLDYLASKGWEVIDLERFLRGLRDPGTLPARAALLTFDDGYRSLRDTTLPLLRRRGSPGVLFMPTDFIGAHNTFDAGREPREPLCGWHDLRALERAGIAVQSHGAAHQRLSQLSGEQQAADLRRSRQTLEAGLQRPVALLAYPFGDAGADRQAMRAVVSEAGYQAACLFGGGTSTLPAADPFFLSRIAMGPEPELPELRRHLEPAAPETPYSASCPGARA